VTIHVEGIIILDMSRGIGSSPFVHFMVQILSHESNNVYTARSFKILNDVAVYTLLDL
jgi:hypothetical protein